MKKFLPLMLICISSIVYTQNIAVTDDDGYTPDNSAMLDVMSTTKGMLVPRVTADQRIAILNPADGLLVFDTDSVSFYFYSGSTWVNLTSANPSDIWAKSSGNVFLSDTTYKLGVGTNSPTGKFIVQADNSIGVEDPLFEVKDKDGQTVFAVHNDGIRVYVDENAKGNIGGFAVSGRSVTKGIKDYMWITKDSIRMYLDDSGKGNIGGFAVSGRSVTKGSYDEYLRVTPDSTRVWVKKGAKGNIGGFAVSGRSVTKGTEEPMFVSTFDSTRIYVDQSAKGNIGGFAVSGRAVTKGSATNFMDLTPENYFIGHESGSNTQPGAGLLGKYNTFYGYQAGLENDSGSSNVFIGNQSGFKNIGGNNNIFIGKNSGYNNLNGTENIFIGNSSGYSNNGGPVLGRGCDNIFMGFNSGRYNTTGQRNVFIGNSSGLFNTIGESNIQIGASSGFYADSGNLNVFIGSYSGYRCKKSGNIFIGTYTGEENTYGEKNTFMGSQCGENNTTGSQNTFIGYIAGHSNNEGKNNVYLGFSAGANRDSTFNNVIIGSQAGQYKATGSNNVFLGNRSGLNSTGSNNIFIGNNAGAEETNDSRLHIHNGAGGTNISLIYGEFNNSLLRINGTLNIKNQYSFPLTDGSSGQVLVTNGSGALSWGSNKSFYPSDLSLLTNIASSKSALNDLMRLNIKSFNSITENRKINFGIIAQEVESVFPQTVSKETIYNKKGEKEECLSIDYNEIGVITIKAVQEQQEIIQKQQKTIEALIKRIEELESK